MTPQIKNTAPRLKTTLLGDEPQSRARQVWNRQIIYQAFVKLDPRQQIHLADWIEEGEHASADEIFEDFWRDASAFLGAGSRTGSDQGESSRKVVEAP